MEWVAWLIPLVVVAVVILSSLGRSLQDAKRLPPPREGPRGPRSSAEVERFLADLNRRRQQQQPQQPPPLPPSKKPRDDRELPQALPVPRAEMPRQPPPLPRPLPPPVVLRETPPPPPPSSVPELIPVAREARRRRQAPATPATAPAPTVANEPAPAVVAALATAPSLKELLRDPQLVRSAMMLREIFDQPVSRRRRRVHGS